MSLSDLGPNWAIIKHPWNWFFIAFSMVLLLFVFHLIFKDTAKNER